LSAVTKVRAPILSVDKLAHRPIDLPPGHKVSRIEVQQDHSVQEQYNNLSEDEIDDLVAEGEELRDLKSEIIKYGHARSLSATYTVDQVQDIVSTLFPE
jgi:hypothetical protein